MASLKLLFLVTLLLIALVGRSSARGCRKNSECTDLCWNGRVARCNTNTGRCDVCERGADVAQENKKLCKSDDDCAGAINVCLPSCKIRCAGGICTCSC